VSGLKAQEKDANVKGNRGDNRRGKNDLRDKGKNRRAIRRGGGAIDLEKDEITKDGFLVGPRGMTTKEG